jgi:hypothetical protein
MGACRLSRRNATIAGKQDGAGDDDDCGQEDTFHVFQFGFMGSKFDVL